MIIKNTGENLVDAEVRGVRLAFSLFVRSVPSARGFKLWAESGKSARLTKPRYAPLREAEEFLLKNWEWLGEAFKKGGEKVVPLSVRLEKFPEIFADGEKLRVILQPSKTGAFFVEDFPKREIVFAFSDEESLEKCVAEYARGKIERLAEKVSKETEISYSKIRIGNQRSRWASRSTTGVVSFNWRMVLLPYELQNYIVRHEFAHARFMDHSVSFWIFLGRICEGARSLDKRLMKTGSAIFNIGR